jgi:pimeloyl-ACP methyl ester carboxylesterase
MLKQIPQATWYMKGSVLFWLANAIAPHKEWIRRLRNDREMDFYDPFYVGSLLRQLDVIGHNVAMMKFRGGEWVVDRERNVETGVLWPSYGRSANVCKVYRSAPFTAFVLPYDWRRSVADTANFVKGAISNLRSLHMAPDLADVPFTIIAHSMGGLVARYLVEKIEIGSDIVDNLICVGTPHLGAIDAFGVLSGLVSKDPIEVPGYDAVDALTLREQQGLMLGWDSSLQLVPTHAAIDAYRLGPVSQQLVQSEWKTPVAWLRDREGQSPEQKLNNARVAAAIIKQTGVARVLQWGDNPHPTAIRYHLIAGSGHETNVALQDGFPQRTAVRNWAPTWTVQPGLSLHTDADGDGTVPFDSAIARFVDPTKREASRDTVQADRYVMGPTEVHARLMEDKNVLRLLTGLLGEQTLRLNRGLYWKSALDKVPFLPPLGYKKTQWEEVHEYPVSPLGASDLL